MHLDLFDDVPLLISEQKAPQLLGLLVSKSTVVKEGERYRRIT
jgi:hypothetical protein